MSGRSAIARSGAASISAGADAVGVHVVHSLQALLALVSAPHNRAAALVLELPRALAVAPCLSDALRGRVQAGKVLPVLALVVPRECVASLRALAAELAHAGALMAVFTGHEVAAARLYVERQLCALGGHALPSGVSVRYRPGFAVQVRGTIAALVEEGWIPPGLALPERSARLMWEAQGQRFSIHRERPAGWAGPRSGWHSLDWWLLRIHTASMPAEALDRLARLEAERLAVRASPAGRIAEAVARKAAAAARRDGSFADFLSALLSEGDGYARQNCSARVPHRRES